MNLIMNNSDKELPPLSLAERERYFNVIYARTHSDFKGETAGVKMLLKYAKYGSGLTCQASISDAELRERYADCTRKRQT
jgi:hypothetical protein